MAAGKKTGARARCARATAGARCHDAGCCKSTATHFDLSPPPHTHTRAPNKHAQTSLPAAVSHGTLGIGYSAGGYMIS
jgi:hypothetical protein